MNKIESDLFWYLCDPNKNTSLGEGRTYNKFIVWVKKFLAPYMAMKFTSEIYYEDLWNEVWMHKNVVQQLPRGHGKTEIIGIWLTIYIAAYEPENPFFFKYKGHHKKIREQTILAGASDDLDAWVTRIKEFFDEVPELQKFKPAGAKSDKTTQKWNKREMVLNNGHKLHLRTMKSRIRGLHVDRVVADDLITESSTLTDRQTIDTWDGAVDGTTTAKEAMVHVIGTPLRFTDIQFHLKNKPEGYFFKARPAIIDDEKQIVLSPNRRNYEDLMRTKKRIGSTKFATEYMLNPIDDSVSLIKREHMLKCLDKYFEGLWLKPVIETTMNDIKVTLTRLNSVEFNRKEWSSIYVTVDFAFSDRITADHTVLSYYGIKQGRAYKLGYIRNPKGEGWSPNTQFAIMSALKDYLGVTMFGLEENSIKGIVKDMRRFNLPIKLFDMASKDAAEQKKPGTEYHARRHTIGKVQSIERLDAAYENQAIVLPYKTEKDQEKIDFQIEESISWAKEEGKLVEIGRHPDIPITDILLNEMIQRSAVATEIAVISRGGSEIEEDEERKLIKGKGIVNA